MMNFKLQDLSTDLLIFVLGILLTLTIGMSLGLYFVVASVGTKKIDLVEYFRGNTVTGDEFEISYEKSFKEITLTSHNHIISFTFIFTLCGIIFMLTQNVSRKLKRILLLEPFLSILVTFFSMYFIRFIHKDFVFLMIFSSILMYASFYLMVFLSFHEFLTEWKHRVRN